MATSHPSQPDSKNDLPRGRGKIPDEPDFLPKQPVFAAISELLKNHPLVIGCIIVGLFAVAILAAS